MRILLRLVIYILIPICSVVFTTKKVWRLCSSEKEELSMMKDKLKELQLDRKKILIDLAHYENPTGKEELARERGYAAVGEQYIPFKYLSKEEDIKEKESSSGNAQCKNDTLD